VWDSRNCLSLNRRERPRWRRAHFDPRSALCAQSRQFGEGRQATMPQTKGPSDQCCRLNATEASLAAGRCFTSVRLVLIQYRTYPDYCIAFSTGADRVRLRHRPSGPGGDREGGEGCGAENGGASRLDGKRRRC
jgi:hypothetical protein